MCSLQSTPGIAAALASNYAGGGCAGWFLPSEDELNELYLQRAVVGGFANIRYWSSSEYNLVAALSRDFSDSFQYFSSKSITLRVRAVRGF